MQLLVIAVLHRRLTKRTINPSFKMPEGATPLDPDILLKKYKQTPFTWGRNTFSKDDFAEESNLRTEYIQSLRKADNKRFQKLIDFIKN